MRKYPYTIARYINGVTLNHLEYVLDENGEQERFVDIESARQFLFENGASHLEVQDCIIEIVETNSAFIQ